MSKQIFAAEYIFPGHPDKLSDAIADALVLEAYQKEPRALVGVEVAVHRDHVYVTGRIGGRDAQNIDVERIVRDVYFSAGYDSNWYPAPDQVKVISNLCLGPLEEGEAEFRELSDDQAICIGYANQYEQLNHLPIEQWLVNRLARRLHRLRAEQPVLGLGPDGKVFISVSEEVLDGGVQWKLSHFSCSLQQKIASDEIALHRAVRVALQDELSHLADRTPGLSAQIPADLTINGAGAFEVGGPEGDNGLSGKKLVVDAYGPRIPIGGGAWSGKDFFKADRAGGLHARRLAKTIVQLGLAEEAQVVLGWFPGDRHARILRITGANAMPIHADKLQNHFDLSLLKSGTDFPVNDLVELARWGHFTDDSLPWERINLL